MEYVGGREDMADTTSEASICDVDGTCYCPLTGVIDTLSRKYAMQLVSIIGAHDSLRFAEIEDHLPTASTSTISKRPRRVRGGRARLTVAVQRNPIACGICADGGR